MVGLSIVLTRVSLQHVFAGATLPFGMAKPVADTGNRSTNLGGFTSDDSPIAQFSQMHDSG